MSQSSPESHPRETLRFGVFEVDRKSAELRKKGVRVKLQGQPFKVLLLLLTRAGEIVTREELREHLWPADTFVDFDRNLNKAVRKLREALGDSADSPRFIETIPRHGYRFVAPVERRDPSAATADATKPSAVFLWATIVASVAIAIAIAWLASRPASPPSAPAASSRVMLAVLPFDNLSDDPDHTYFGEGLAEEMITTLGRLKPEQLGVIARSSVEQYRSGPRPPARIGAELGVDYLLEGSVRRHESRVRVAARLIRVRDQSQLWADVYDRELTDVFSIQIEVAEQIATSLSVELVASERATLETPPTDNTEAYESYLRGIYAMRPFTGDSMMEAASLFEEALALDPDVALAQAKRSRAYWNMAQPLLAYSYRDAMEIAKSAAVAALDSDDEEAIAHGALAWVHAWYDWDWDAAEASFRRALELNPSATNVRLGYAFLLSATSQHERALAEANTALNNAPLDFGLRTGLAELYLHARRYDDAVAECDKVLSFDVDYQRAYLILRWVAEARGEIEKAVDAQIRFTLLGGAEPERARALRDDYETAGARGYWSWHLRVLEEPGARFHRTELASVLAGLGEPDRAFEALEQAYSMRAGDLILLRVAPWFDPLRSDPRFDALVERMRFH